MFRAKCVPVPDLLISCLIEIVQGYWFTAVGNIRIAKLDQVLNRDVAVWKVLESATVGPSAQNHAPEVSGKLRLFLT